MKSFVTEASASTRTVFPLPKYIFVRLHLEPLVFPEIHMPQVTSEDAKTSGLHLMRTVRVLTVALGAFYSHRLTPSWDTRLHVIAGYTTPSEPLRIHASSGLQRSRHTSPVPAFALECFSQTAYPDETWIHVRPCILQIDCQSATTCKLHSIILTPRSAASLKRI
jgi:hypothetical protein